MQSTAVPKGHMKISTVLKCIAVAALLWGTYVYAAPIPLSPMLPVDGVTTEEWGHIVQPTMIIMREALTKYAPKWTPNQRELQCMAFRFARTMAQAAVVIEEVGAAKSGRPVDAGYIERHQKAVAYLAKLEDQWCNGQGGNTNQVASIMTQWRNDNALQAKSMVESIRDKIKGLDAKPVSSWTAAEWVMVGGIIVVAVGADLIPAP